MADHEHRPTERFEFVEEPTLGRLVEVVGGFVQHHRLGLLVEHAHQVDSPALTTREGGEVLEQQVLFESKSVGQSRHFGLGLVAAALAELLLQRGEAGDRLVGRIRRQRVAGVLHVGVERVDATGREHVAEPDRLNTEAAGNGLLG